MNHLAIVGATPHLASGVSSDAIAVEVGKNITFGSPIALIQVDFDERTALSPASGEVVEVNENLDADPSLLSKGGDKAWLVKVKNCMFDMELMSKDKYEEYCKGAGLQ